MRKTVFVFIQGHKLSTASSNRKIAMLKAMVRNDVSVKVMSIGIAGDPIPQIDGVEFIELRNWKKHFRKGDYYFQYFFSQFKLRKYIKTMPYNSTVLLEGCRDYLHLFVKRKDFNIFQEVTEHHSAIRTYRVSRYLKNCYVLKGIFVISSSLKHLYESIGYPTDNIHIVNMFADIDRFVGLNKEPVFPPYIAYCGDMSNSKDGVNHLVEAFSKIVNKTNWNLWLIGYNNGYLDNYIKQKGLGARIVFTGVVDYNKVPQILKNASALALARPDSVQAANGFPTKLGEYLLTGNPVVITRVGDIPLFLKHKVSALISDSKDMDSFADNLLWVSEHPEEAIAIGLKGRLVAENNFNYITETQKMYDVMFSNNNISIADV